MPYALGIESTAWNFSAAVATEEEVLSIESAPYRPQDGGIHPREASRSHAENAASTVRAALERSGLDPSDLDLVAFARGPGMGPCLRVGATAARAIGHSLDVPVVGVNHCLAHVEVGLFDTEASAPAVLNVSGANTQVLLGREGRYRVFGETLDVGLGNALDKLGREAGLSHPGGPKVEAEAGKSSELLDLPYSVKGMDLAFSGLVTAAASKLDRGLPAVCNSFQEIGFSMVTEVAERCMAHASVEELLMVGGVARNERLREMLDEMCGERGARLHRPSRELLGDNGAMIAVTGLKMHRWGLNGGETVDQGERVDGPEAPWIGYGEDEASAGAGLPRGAELRGAEAVVRVNSTVRKERLSKGYRHPALDSRLRRSRTRREARALGEARRLGVPTPIVLSVGETSLEMERVEGEKLRDAPCRELLEEYVQHLAALHDSGMVHGDPTTSNAVVEGDGLTLIDFGMAEYVDEVEPKAVDLHLFLTCLASTHGLTGEDLLALDESYLAQAEEGDEVLERVGEIRGRGRYL
ncbi:MAG: putative bifunctional tRNA threonylcarbamoyladenosine biosynthesis protein [Methanonatronarchaeales archaeon]|nr:putative bifunctional tRNA threonylcarbamoyladenosine biosynthesis protein [Methanonatronarchaeales archaeon]